MKTGTIGTIIHGTMRPQDLVPVFLSELEHYLKASHQLDNSGHPILDHNMVANIGPIRARVHDDDWTDVNGLTYFESDYPQSDLAFLFDALNEHAPVGCYFGSHEGDGSDFGFWPSIESLEENEDVLSCDDGRDGVPIPGHIMFTNDHGNVTLYRVKLEEVWSVG